MLFSRLKAGMRGCVASSVLAALREKGGGLAHGVVIRGVGNIYIFIDSLTVQVGEFNVSLLAPQPVWVNFFAMA